MIFVSFIHCTNCDGKFSLLHKTDEEIDNWIDTSCCPQCGYHQLVVTSTFIYDKEENNESSTS